MAEAFKSGNIGEHSELLAVARIILDGYLELGVPDEIGPQSLVSAVLSGKRKLNLRQVKALAKRFRVPMEAFVEDR